MKHRDLGRLDGDLVLFGGPYSNLQVTEALVARARVLAVPPGRMICTGDTVAYCGAPQRTVALLRALGCPVVAGNCEIQLAENAEDCGCGFEEGSACDLLSVSWYAFARARIGSADRAWMRDLPEVISFQHHGRRFAVIHGGVPDVARFIWQTDDEEVFADQWRSIEARIGPVDGVIAGHSGLPFIRETRRGPWINAGVIGMPPHDGGTDTRFAVLSGGTARIETLAYDVTTAQAEMAAAGLPAGYRDALGSGYWPSEDVLPPSLRVPVSARG